eukprot:823210-Pyramimonas_sp.AAC.1
MASPRPFALHAFRGPQGAPPRAPVAASAWRRTDFFGIPLTRLVAPGSFTEGPGGCVRLTLDHLQHSACGAVV